MEEWKTRLMKKKKNRREEMLELWQERERRLKDRRLRRVEDSVDGKIKDSLG